MPKIVYAAVIENGIEIRKPVILEDRLCVVCGEKFTPSRQQSDTCSRKCSKKKERDAHKERYQAKAKEWYANNTERAKERRKKYYHENADYFKEKTKEWNRNNRERKLQNDREYKDRTRHGGFKQKLIEKHGCICSGCGAVLPSNQLSAHHVTFDKTQHDDQVLLCKPCHAKIHSLGQKRRKEITKKEIVEAINSSKNLEEASKMLGIQRCTLYQKRKEFGLLG